MLKDFVKTQCIYSTHRVLIDHIRSYKDKFDYKKDEEGFPYGRLKEDNGWNLKFYYLPGENSSKLIPTKIAQKCGITIDEYFFLRDYITRYLYPHMLPGICPEGAYRSLAGFHGQQKDSIPHVEDLCLKNKLYDLFSPLPDDIIIDCGAYIGFGELRLSRHLTSGKIIAVEGTPDCYRVLEKNVKENSINNVIAVNHAIWEKNEKRFINLGKRQGNSLINELAFDKEKDGSEVECVNVDSIVEEYDLKKVDFVSLTLNGAEPEALQGMKNTLSNFSPRLRIAGWYKRDGVRIGNLCKNILDIFGYETIIGPHFNVFAIKR